MAELPTGTVTLLFTDIEGSTRLLAELGDRYAEALAEHRRVLRSAFEHHGGVEVDTQGDAFFYAFPKATDAVAAAERAQHALSGGRVSVRIGVHTGEPTLTEEGYIGADVHRAARIMGAGHGGQVLLSQTTRDLLDSSFELRDLGEHRLKDIGEPQRLFQLGDRDFPPLVTVEVARIRLPAPASALIGRRRELTEVSELLREDRCVTLTGPGGTGKTRLALAIASELAEDFADGALFVELAPVAHSRRVAGAVARAAGLDEAGPDMLPTLIDYFGDREVLLVLDNFEHVLDAAPIISDLLRMAPGLKVLVTSRARLNVSGEREYPVSPLPVPRPDRLPDLDTLESYDGATFFLDRARAARPDLLLNAESARTVAEICVALDGLPLALELAAPRLKILSPEALLSRLGQRLDVLTGDSRDLPDRQQTLRATIDWTHDLLDQEEQELFAKLGVFRGGFTIEAVEAITNLYAERTAETLLALVDWNLVVPVHETAAGPRLQLLETIREYALERLEALDAHIPTRALHAHFFLGLAEAAEPGLRGSEQALWLARLDADNDNIRAAFSTFEQLQEVEAGFRLAASLWRFWQIRGQLEEGRGQVERLLELDGKAAGERDHARALACLGRLAFFQGDYATARSTLQASLTMQLKHGDTWEVAFLVMNLGMLATAEARYAEAREFFDDSIAMFRRLRDGWGECAALAYLARVAHAERELSEARDLFHASVAAGTAAGERRMVAYDLSHLGEIAQAEGSHDEAARFYSEALTTWRELEDTWGIATTLGNLAKLAQSDGDVRAALALLEESLAIWWDAGDRRGIAATLDRVGEVAAAEGDAEVAVRLIAAADALYASIGAVRDAEEKARFERSVEEIRRSLGEATFSAGWDEGRALPLAAAVSLAKGVE